MVILLQWESGGGLEKERRERERNEGKKEEKRERKTGRKEGEKIRVDVINTQQKTPERQV